MGLSQTIIPKEQRKLTPSFSDQHNTDARVDTKINETDSIWRNKSSIYNYI